MEKIMNIDEQIELLMQGTEYGDEDLKKAMKSELRDRLVISEKEGGLYAYIADMIPHPLTCIWAIRFPCVNSVSFRIWVTK